MEFWDLFFLGLLGVVIIVIVIGGVFLKRHKRKQYASRKFPDKWTKILKSNVKIYKFLPEAMKRELEGRIHIFLEEKDFEGCRGIEIGDEIKVTVAGLACVLLLNKNFDYFPYLQTVLIYPSAYIAMGCARMGNQVIHDEQSARLGESWNKGAVVLAWEHVKENGKHYASGHNVVFHEFAHQLDQENGVSDGVPILSSRAEGKEFAEVLYREYEHLKDEVEHGIRDIIDPYGATNPAEFFAVSTEVFFELPKHLSKYHSELYKELKIFYKVDPLSWQ